MAPAEQDEPTAVGPTQDGNRLEHGPNRVDRFGCTMILTVWIAQPSVL